MIKTIGILLSFVALLGTSSDLNRIRASYFNATTAEGVKEFKEAAMSCNENSAVCTAYQGAALAMSAGFSPGLVNRIGLFNDGKELIEKAVFQDQKNPEIRFIRYSIQANVPAILFYSSDLDEDFELIERHLINNKEADEFWKEALRVMSVSDGVSEEHLERIEKLKVHLR